MILDIRRSVVYYGFIDLWGRAKAAQGPHMGRPHSPAYDA